MTQATADETGIQVPPPAVYAAGFLIGWGLDRATDFSAGQPLVFWGVTLMLLGIGTAGWAVATFHRARTTWSPRGGSTTLVEEGPYAHTRNPMYVALTLAYVGGAFMLGRAGPLLTLPLVLLWLDRLVIRREEAYLQEKFGAAYQAYRKRVRRWI